MSKRPKLAPCWWCDYPGKDLHLSGACDEDSVGVLCPSCGAASPRAYDDGDGGNVDEMYAAMDRKAAKLHNKGPKR